MSEYVLKVRCTGIRPLMMNAVEGNFSPSPEHDKLVELAKLRKPTEADKREIEQLKYFLALYFDPKLGPYLPGFNLWASVRDAAAMHRQKAAWIRGAQVMEQHLPLLYKGPRTPEKLFANGNFVDMRPAKIPGGGVILAVRPIFPQWQIEATVLADDTAIGEADAKRAIANAGLLTGVGTFRQRFGRFSTEITEITRADLPLAAE